MEKTSKISIHGANHSKTEKKFNTIYLVKVALLSAIAYIIFILEFPLPYFPPFLEIDFSDTVAIIGGIILGPVATVIIQFMKNLLRFIMFNSGTGGIGEFANFLVGVAYVLPFCLIFKRNNVKRFVIGSLTAIIVMTITAGLVNYFINIPVYTGITSHTEKMGMIFGAYIPFNLIKGVIVTIFSGIVIKAFKPTILKKWS
ncbi:riboflavin transporter [Vallitalea longa]|uniref:Riboflavin transporter n=1 Tax=Vallitalea longa TaxID=2936439 RepID=A0A9W6DH48_9FIRM|nr:ECF transporter S component [Vallitalea longa]GKX30484.1 riboflavin transporter [Vallitalea longa]